MSMEVSNHSLENRRAKYPWHAKGNTSFVRIERFSGAGVLFSDKDSCLMDTSELL
jgi:hypothetical protein